MDPHRDWGGFSGKSSIRGNASFPSINPSTQVELDAIDCKQQVFKEWKAITTRESDQKTVVSCTVNKLLGESVASTQLAAVGVSCKPGKKTEPSSFLWLNEFFRICCHGETSVWQWHMILATVQMRPRRIMGIWWGPVKKLWFSRSYYHVRTSCRSCVHQGNLLGGLMKSRTSSICAVMQDQNAHGSPWRWLNRLVPVLCFVPSLSSRVVNCHQFVRVAIHNTQFLKMIECAIFSSHTFGNLHDCKVHREMCACSIQPLQRVYLD